MEATPGSPPPKRTRAKASTAESSVTKPARKTPAVSRKKKVVATDVAAPEVVATALAAAQPEIVSNSLTETELTASDLRSKIATAAFYRAEARHFAPGHELEDWLEAERQVLAQYA